MRKSFFRLVVILGIFVCTMVVSAQSKSSVVTTIGFAIVDVEAVVKEMPEAVEADKQLKEVAKKYNDSLEKMQKSLEAKIQNYQKQKGMMAADKQQQEEEKLQKENQEAQMLYQEKFGQTGEIAQLREKLLEPIRQKVRTAIEAVAKDEKVSLVLSKDSAMVLFADSKLDITFRVIDKIKRDK